MGSQKLSILAKCQFLKSDLGSMFKAKYVKNIILPIQTIFIIGLRICFSIKNFGLICSYQLIYLIGRARSKMVTTIKLLISKEK